MVTETANASMVPLLASARAREVAVLDPSLQSLVHAGLAEGPEGTRVFAERLRGAPVACAAFGDRVGFEAWFNKLRIADCSEALGAAPAIEQLAHGLLLAHAVGDQARRAGRAVTAILTVERGVVFRFHGVRPGDRPWVKDAASHTGPLLLLAFS